ncbi:MAG TPA: sugar phosphate nucleotidyltransferase, partial [bacterium]|nr:sugar phosphate nucleotidyltransferase [bacterium]
MKVRQAVIPAAGLGINFLPITKTIPKELLPIIDKTCLEYVFAEGISAGVEEFIVVISKEKQIIRDYFEDSQYMIDWLRNRHLDNLIPTLNPLPKNIKLTFVY